MVRPAITLRKVAWICASVPASIAEVASSRIRTAGSVISALARDTRCRWWQIRALQQDMRRAVVGIEDDRIPVTFAIARRSTSGASAVPSRQQVHAMALSPGTALSRSSETPKASLRASTERSRASRPAPGVGTWRSVTRRSPDI